MQTSTIEQTLERAAEETAVIIKFGFDVHATQVTACRQWDGRLPQPAQQLTKEEVLRMVQEHVARGHRVYTCYEAGPCGYGLHRQLVQLGATNYVVAPQRWDERGQRVKTDRRDARELCQRLDRYVRGNTDVFTVVRVPTEQQERLRLLCRQRASLLKERQRCELRGHGLMLVHGFEAPRAWWSADEWRELAVQLPEWLREHLARWQKYAQQLEQQVEELTPRIAALSAGQAAPKGLGAMTNAILEVEIGDWGRFRNRRQPGSYTGLCPSEDSSNRRRRQGSVTKHGNPRIRHLLVEAAWRMLEWQPDYPPIKKARALQGRLRKRAIVAAARQLAVDLWRLRTGRCTPEQLKLVMVEL
jgi:transposase